MKWPIRIPETDLIQTVTNIWCLTTSTFSGKQTYLKVNWSIKSLRFIYWLKVGILSVTRWIWFFAWNREQNMQTGLRRVGIEPRGAGAKGPSLLVRDLKEQRGAEFKSKITSKNVQTCCLLFPFCLKSWRISCWRSKCFCHRKYLRFEGCRGKHFPLKFSGV